MWTLATSAIALPIAFLSGTLEERLCLLSTSIVRIRILAAAYRAYHTLIFEYKQMISRASNSKDLDEVYMTFIGLVRTAWLHP